MSLVGLLTVDGTDLSYVFHNKNNPIFEKIINTDFGINGPSTSISYIAGMIGYINTINPSTTNISVTSGSVKSLANFTLTPGMYLCISYSYNTYTSSGILNNFYLGVSSTNNATSTDGVFVNILSSINLPNSTVKTIIGHAFFPLKVTTTKTYYLIHQLDFSSVTVSNTPNATTQTYFKYTQIG